MRSAPAKVRPHFSEREPCATFCKLTLSVPANEARPVLTWLLRLILIPSGVVAGWFVAKDAPNFGIVQATVALFLIVFVVAVIALTNDREEKR